MDSKNNQQLKQTKHVNRLDDTREKERLLMQYGGIFKNNIKEYGEKIMKRHKRQINYAR